MHNTTPIERFVVLFMPWLISLLFISDPVLSYFTAWLGSFVIFYLTLSGWIRPLPDDMPVASQIMRPVFLVQIIFAGYMACSSIFYFMNLLGYDNFQKLNYFLVNDNKLRVAAQCQRYYCLGHASFVSGILLFMNYPVKQKYFVKPGKLSGLLLTTALVSLSVSIILLRIPGLSQFYYQLNSLSFISGTLALAFAIPEKKIWNTLICITLYLFNFYQAFISGFKEPIIVSILVLGIFLYPSYKKLVIITFGPVLILLFAFLPAYVSSFRQNAWSGAESTEDASQIALDAALHQEGGDTNWGFLVFRLSEIDMFTEFVESTPSNIDYYGMRLVNQSAIAILPRIFWPSKPSTEDLVMERVYAAGVVNRASTVSAKPAFIVDAYLSGGVFGIFVSLFIYGALAQYISLKAEELFGGYTLGTALIFTGLFQIFWRGLSFEFLINSVFWSYVSMLVMFKVFRSKNIVEKL
ncbi:exosortase Y-associated Wzy-like protein [Mucilaginibacter flavus]|uniref:exosortase Y-associated Wzy-like protein n=1 Tax=Mucilaginibacter flavus TaxID=931504 RepID=UPI0025B2888C|nr:hypothetical protein [Mucilaginibacter flavus]MDN3584427.1 hypothetical protein [Mucilaginibacter flavus]